ncbi:MAG: hypothetical protein IJ410_07620 [Oscillospiraceae bacterium]|nr:hypothetical protein [Oscillospiraceae bacterium]
MQNILYKSENIIPWDTQSAFKMTSYRVQREENMVFCYMKAYVHQNDLVLCSYCFTEKPAPFANMHLYLGLDRENPEKVIKINYGYDGIESIQSDKMTVADVIYRSFKADDEQGFYWCGEITIDGDFIRGYSGTSLQEKSLLTMNLTQSFENGDFAVLFGNAEDQEYKRTANMGVFVVLNY